jgi:hypothetical protein
VVDSELWKGKEQHCCERCHTKWRQARSETMSVKRRSVNSPADGEYTFFSIR